MPYAQVNDARIYWEEEGAGAAALLINGLGYPGAMWYRLLPYLTDRYRTICVDNRGVGATGVVPGPYSIEMMADDAVAVLDDAGVDVAHVIGASMGGFIAQEVVLRHPERVRSLVLGCTNTNGPGAVPPPPDALEMLTTRTSLTPREAAELARPFVYAPDTDDARVEEDIAVRMRQPTSPEGYTLQLQAVIAHPGTDDRLAQIQVPTLVLQGTIDRLVSPENAAILGAGIPHARVEMLDGASHVFFTDRPEQSGKLIRDFLDSVA